MSVQLNVDNQNVTIKPEDLKQPRSKSIELYDKILGADKETPPAFSNLKGRIETLKKTEEKLTTAKDRSLWDKCWAFAATAALVSFIGGAIFALMYGTGGLGLGIGVGLIGLYLVLTEAYNQYYADWEGAKEGEKRQVIQSQGNPFDLIKVFVAAPFIPIYKAFTKISDLEGQVKDLHTELPKEIAAVRKFHADHHELLKQKLQSDIEEYQRGQLATVDKDARIKECKEALEDLKIAAEY